MVFVTLQLAAPLGHFSKIYGITGYSSSLHSFPFHIVGASQPCCMPAHRPLAACVPGLCTFHNQIEPIRITRPYITCSAGCSILHLTFPLHNFYSRNAQFEWHRYPGTHCSCPFPCAGGFLVADPGTSMHHKGGAAPSSGSLSSLGDGTRRGIQSNECIIAVIRRSTN